MISKIDGKILDFFEWIAHRIQFEIGLTNFTIARFFWCISLVSQISIDTHEYKNFTGWTVISVAAELFAYFVMWKGIGWGEKETKFNGESCAANPIKVLPGACFARMGSLFFLPISEHRSNVLLAWLVFCFMSLTPLPPSFRRVRRIKKFGPQTGHV